MPWWSGHKRFQAYLTMGKQIVITFTIVLIHTYLKWNSYIWFNPWTILQDVYPELFPCNQFQLTMYKPRKHVSNLPWQKVYKTDSSRIKQRRFHTFSSAVSSFAQRLECQDHFWKIESTIKVTPPHLMEFKSLKCIDWITQTFMPWIGVYHGEMDVLQWTWYFFSYHVRVD